ncbi:LysR family transcriptional regulator [Paraburkholderia panacisoli]|uniref:LysR family transcriptional regulator n=2 Tax=Paraburkholderia panacisoli TaxID=2603818 RepID=A0A5B0H817_9BURK|nr:LysR family transcriptional regulator [Paraburkholderia panacisoli]KAA1011232.1 LysR family transcriptional regulator [Paraburkholderia panacisoli]
MDRFGSLNIFVRAAETRSFTEAGRKLGISSSAVGKAISRLEGRLGVRLFHRSTRSIALTPEGATFLTRCQRIIGEIEAAETELALANAEPRGRLRVSMPMVSTLMMPVIGAFMRAYPDITLDIDFSDRMVDVIEEGFDVVTRTGDAADSTLVTPAMGVFRQMIVGSPAYFARRGMPTEPEQLREHACLQHRFPTTGKLRRWPLSRDGETLDIELPTVAIATAVEPLTLLAEQGLGLACAPDFTVRAQLAQGSLVAVLQPYLDTPSVFRALWPSGRQISPKARVFVDYLSQHLFPDSAAAVGEDAAKRD